MASWADLARELDLWGEYGREARLWWRDDDARAPTPALERLLALAAAVGIPVALAVIPADLDPGLGPLVARFPAAFALQHGWAHANHAPATDRQCEYGLDRPIDVMLAELAAGRAKLAALPRFVPVLVAPWNRIAPELVPLLPQAGVCGLSTLGPRPAPIAGVAIANVHIDIMDWQAGRFAGESAVLTQAIAHLRAKRTGRADAGEPTGLMTHHPYHDEACWRFIETFLARSRAHPAVRWLDAAEVFGA